jgi:hypothetical protein
MLKPDRVGPSQRKKAKFSFLGIITIKLRKVGLDGEV